MVIKWFVLNIIKKQTKKKKKRRFLSRYFKNAMRSTIK